MGVIKRLYTVASCQMTSYSLITKDILQYVSSIDRNATYWSAQVYIRNYKWKLNLCMLGPVSLIHSQVMRNPALQWQRVLCALKHGFIWSAAEFPVPAQACDSFKVLRRLGHLRD